MGDEKKMVGYIEAHLPNRRLGIREKTAQRGTARKKNRRRHARVGDVSRVTDGGLRENETTHRNARNTTAGTSPSPSNPVVGSMRGKGSERGRAFAAGRDGARRRVESIETRARARQGTRAPRSERVEPACRCRRLREKYRRVDVFHARLEFRVRRGRRDARNADAPAVAAEGDRAYGILTRSPIQSVRTSPSPVVAPSADILPDASRVPVANEDASLGLAEPHRWRARGGADRESARAPRTPTRSRSLASARARRKCVVLARLRVRGARRPGRERSGEALRRRRQRREFEGTAPRWRRLMHRRVERV